MVKKRSAIMIGYFGNRNYGDDLMFSIISAALKDAGFTHIWVDSNSITLVEEGSPHIKSSKKKNTTCSVLKVYRHLASLRDFYFVARDTATITVGGGSLISSTVSMRALCLLNARLVVGRMMGAEILGMGLGISRLQSLPKRLLASLAIALMDQVYVRDQRSYDAAITMGAASKISLSSDIVYGLNRNSFTKNDDKRSMHVGVSVAARFLNVGLTSEDHQRFRNELCECINRLTDDGTKVSLLVFHNSDDPSYSDLAYYSSMAPSLRGPCETVVLDAKCSAGHSVYSTLDAVLGMRYHSLILAAKHGLPFLGISMDPKILSACEDYGMPYAHPNDFNSEQSVLELKGLEFSKANLSTLELRETQSKSMMQDTLCVGSR